MELARDVIGPDTGRSVLIARARWRGLAAAAFFVLALSGCATIASLDRPDWGADGRVGAASWYGPRHHGRRTASGQIFDMHALVAAHRTLPFGSRVRVTNLENGRSVVLRIVDRGPFVEDRLIDVSYAAAKTLGMVDRGVVRVRLEVLSPGD